MIAILKRELKAYFTSVIGWIFMAAFFFVFNLYFVANNLIYGTPYLSYSLNNVAFVLLIIIPILAMRSMSDDRRTKTDQLLYTSPVSVPKVILGKFLALVLVFSIVVGAICLCRCCCLDLAAYRWRRAMLPSSVCGCTAACPSPSVSLSLL